MKEWAELPVSAQMKRIRGALASVLPRWGLGNADLKFIFHGENTTFRAFTKRGSFLVRVHRKGYNSPKQTESELAWVEALHADTGLAPRPARARDGSFVAELDEPGVHARHVCVFHWVEGSVLGRRLSAETLRGIGELMARLHDHADGWKRPRGFTRHNWQKMAILSRDEQTDREWQALPREHRREFEAIRRDAIAAVKSLSHHRDMGLLHADLHRMNVLRTPRGLAAIDFDDCGFAPWVYDVAVAGAYWPERQRERYDTLLEGYHRVREFPAHQLAHLSLLVAARLASVCVWVTSRAADNAKFRPGLKATQDRLLRMARNALDGWRAK